MNGRCRLPHVIVAGLLRNERPLVATLSAMILVLACSPSSPVEPKQAETEIQETARSIQLRHHAGPGTWAALDKRGAVFASGPLLHSSASESEVEVRLAMAARTAFGEEGAERLYARASAADPASVTVLRMMALPLSGHLRMGLAHGPEPRCEVSLDAPEEEIDEYLECGEIAAADPDCEVLVQEWFKRERKLHIHCEPARR